MRAAGAGAVLMGAAGACLDPLPPALSCPPAAKTPYCFVDGGVPSSPPLLDAGQMPGAGGPVVPECFAEDMCLLMTRSACMCGTPSECSSAAPTCYETGCPAAAPPGATCIALPAAGITYTSASGTPAVPSVALCSCGCASCASAVDGIGPILGPMVGILVPLGAASLPEAGEVNVYARWRGSADVGVTLLGGGGEGMGGVGAVVDSADFQEQVLTPMAGSPASPFTLSVGSRPMSVLVMNGSGAALEIDALMLVVTP